MPDREAHASPRSGLRARRAAHPHPTARTCTPSGVPPPLDTWEASGRAAPSLRPEVVGGRAGDRSASPPLPPRSRQRGTLGELQAALGPLSDPARQAPVQRACPPVTRARSVGETQHAAGSPGSATLSTSGEVPASSSGTSPPSAAAGSTRGPDQPGVRAPRAPGRRTSRYARVKSLIGSSRHPNRTAALRAFSLTSSITQKRDAAAYQRGQVPAVGSVRRE